MLLTRYNDFRKIASIESYTPTDNASELTARINDDGWETSYETGYKAADCVRQMRCSSFPSAVAMPNLESVPTW